MTAPLYRSLADQLRQDILSGRAPAGSQLPTELELCAVHGVSRHTARDALRLLREEGLIERRRGAGTRVAERRLPSFLQQMDGMEALLQYAREARLHVTDFARTRGELAPHELGIEPGDAAWVRITGLRGGVTADAPIALSRIWIRGDLAPGEDTARAASGPLIPMVEHAHRLRPSRVEQTITAVALGRTDAAALKVDTKAPALRTLRRYLSPDDGTLIAVSDTLHPGARFAYTMEVRRD